MELRMRVEQLAAPTRATTTAATLPPHALARVLRLARVEREYATLRRMRVLLACYAVAAVVLASLSVDPAMHAGLALFQHLVLLASSLLGLFGVYGVYRAKAHLAGLRNHAATPTHDDGSGVASVLHSPHLGAMLLEAVVWLLQAPPGLPRDAAAVTRVLDDLVWLRLYAVVLAVGDVACGGVFARGVSALCAPHAHARPLLRRCGDWACEHAAGAVGGVVVAWLLVALLYAQAEGDAVGYGDALYFCLATASFVGYGDYEPVTPTGRLCAVLSWLLGVVVLAGCVGALRRALALTDAERNLHTLFRVNKLCARVPGEAARTVQRAWRLHDARRRRRNAAALQFNAFLLTQQAATFRALRRRFAAAEGAFLRSMRAFDGDGGDGGGEAAAAFASWSPASSRPGTPRGAAPVSPRRRPFSLFQTTRVKSTSGATTPRSARTPVASPQVPPTIAAAGGGSGSVDDNSGGGAGLDERLARLERCVDALAGKAAQLAGALRVSATQLDS